MENKDIEQLFERAQEVKEKVFDKEQYSEKEYFDRRINEMAEIKGKANEIRKQVKEQKTLLEKLGLKKKDTTILRQEFESLRTEYYKILEDLESKGLSKEDVAEQETRIILLKKKEKQNQEAKNLKPSKMRLFEKIKGIKDFVIGKKINTVLDKEGAFKNIKAQLEKEKSQMIKEEPKEVLQEDLEEMMSRDVSQEQQAQDKYKEMIEEDENEPELEKMERPSQSFEIKEEKEIEEDLSAKFKEFLVKEEEQRDTERKEIENIRNTSVEQEAIEKLKKQEEEEEEEKTTESMDRPSQNF